MIPGIFLPLHSTQRYVLSILFLNLRPLHSHFTPHRHQLRCRLQCIPPGHTARNETMICLPRETCVTRVENGDRDNMRCTRLSCYPFVGLVHGLSRRLTSGRPFHHPHSDKHGRFRVDCLGDCVRRGSQATLPFSSANGVVEESESPCASLDHTRSARHWDRSRPGVSIILTRSCVSSHLKPSPRR